MIAFRALMDGSSILREFVKIGLFFSALSFTSSHGDQYSYYPQDPSVAEYLNRMPWQHYASIPYAVTNLAWFWVDNARDPIKDIIKKGIMWKPYILEVLASYVKPGDEACDIGAHMGTISMELRQLVGCRGKVYAFESERQFFRELVQNAKLNGFSNVIPHLCRIGKEDGEVPITHFYGAEYSSVHQRSDGPWSLHKHCLDSFGLSNIAVMKIAVDGAEDSVIEGARQTIVLGRPVIVIEIMGKMGANIDAQTRQERINHTTSLLEELNYTVTHLCNDDYLALPKEKSF